MNIEKITYKILYTLSSSKVKERLPLQREAWKLAAQDNSYWVQTGYLRSRLYSHKPEDNAGNPVPWMPYPFIAFLKERLNKEMNVFEYGSGNSTLFFAKRVKKIVSVEYDKNWFEEIGSLTRNESNVTLVYTELNEKYPTEINNHNEKYDVIIIDGRKRVRCAKAALERLSENGVLILDDSFREYYKEIFSVYQEAGFKYLNFEGLKPISLSTSKTTVFYKSGNNCFGL